MQFALAVARLVDAGHILTQFLPIECRLHRLPGLLRELLHGGALRRSEFGLLVPLHDLGNQLDRLVVEPLAPGLEQILDVDQANQLVGGLLLRGRVGPHREGQAQAQNHQEADTSAPHHPLLSTSAWATVPRSVCSSSPPTGTPRAMRETFRPRAHSISPR